MTKTEILKNIKEHTNSLFISAKQAALLTGRSKNEANAFVAGLQSIPSGGEGKRKLYFVGDIADRCIDLRDSKVKLESTNKVR